MPHAPLSFIEYLTLNRLKALTLTGVEFIRCLRLHLLPPGFHHNPPLRLAWQQSPPPACAPGPSRSGHLAAALCPRRPHGRPRSRSPARTARAPRRVASGASNVPAKSASLPAPGSPGWLPLTPIPHEPSAQPAQTMPARNPRAASEPQRSPPGFVSTRLCRLPAPSEVARQTAHGRLPPRNPMCHSARGAVPPGGIQPPPPTSPITSLARRSRFVQPAR